MNLNLPGADQILVFTDLDGTLLDHETYSFQPALPALRLLRENDIPLIICTSKTRAEIEKIRVQLQNSHPFIPENGGAVFIPGDYFPFSFSFDREEEGYRVIELGTHYRKLRDELQRMRQKFPGKIKGFGDLSPRNVAALCGLSLEEARLAKKREYDEPFLLEDEKAEEAVRELARRAALQVTRGGRFFHLTGNNDKGKAVLLLRNIYRKKSKRIKTIGLGDSLNDLPMLLAVDYPVLVQKPDGSYDPAMAHENLMRAPGRGPEGWSRALLNLIQE